MDFLNYIDLIKESSKSECFIKGRECIEVDKYYVSFWKDNDNYLNGLQFTDKNNISWDWSNPEEFYKEYLNSKIEFIEYSFRRYGENKLSKPSELKGMSKAFSIDYIPKKARCQVFIKNNDVWIKHVDYFSPSLDIRPEDQGSNLKTLCNKYCDDNSRKSKFVYDDCFGDIVLRSEAWLCIKNLLNKITKNNHPELVTEILNQQYQKSILDFDGSKLENTEISRFFDNLLLELSKNNIR